MAWLSAARYPRTKQLRFNCGAITIDLWWKLIQFKMYGLQWFEIQTKILFVKKSRLAVQCEMSVI
jgi:hypothetical protein